jgi:putative DNA primase/helicase
VIPVYGIDCGHEVIVSLERITPDGEKLFEAGSHIRAGYCFLPVGPIPSRLSERVWVAEGFATGATVALATGEAVCCVFNCGNFTPALQVLRQRMPGTVFILASDNDFTKPGNPGQTAAIAAARRFGLRAIWPTFPPGAEGSDFNDLALEIGIDAVREELQSITTVQASDDFLGA